MDLHALAHFDWLAFIQKVAYTIGAVLAVLGAIRSWPMLMAKAELVRERDVARSRLAEADRERHELREMVKTFSAGMDALHFVRDRIEEMQRVQVIALRYIVDLIQHILDGGEPHEMPPIPPEIGDEVRDEIRARSERPQPAGVSLSAVGEAASA